MSDIINMNNNELLLEIRNGISSLVNGEILPEQAESMLHRLEESCAKLESETSPRELNLESRLTALLYRHNTENFAKLTIILRKTGEFFLPFAYAGSLEFIPAMEKIIQTNSAAIIAQELSCYNTQDAAGMPYRFFFDYAQNTDGKYITAAAVSSTYSTWEKFDDIAKNISDYLTGRISVLPDSLDYLNRSKRYAENFLQSNILAGRDVEAALFSFESFKKMFGHRGLEYMMTISNILFSRLRGFYGEEALIIAISLDMYLIIFSNDNVDNFLEESKKISFTHENITLKFTKYAFQLRSFDELETMWLEIGKKRLA